MRGRLLWGAGLAAFAVLAGAQVVHGAGIVVSPNSFPPGGSFVITCAGFQPHEPLYAIWDNSTQVGMSQADAGGGCHIGALAPSNASPCQHLVSVVGQTSDHASAPVTVTPCPTPSPTPTRPPTRTPTPAATHALATATPVVDAVTSPTTSPPAAGPSPSPSQLVALSGTPGGLQTTSQSPSPPPSRGGASPTPLGFFPVSVSLDVGDGGLPALGIVGLGVLLLATGTRSAPTGGETVIRAGTAKGDQG